MSLFFGDNRFTKKKYLLNAYASKGVIKETGVVFDSTHVWLMVPQKNPGGTMGLGYEALKWGDSSNFDKIKHINFLNTGPVAVEVELEEIQQGTGDREKKVNIVHSLRLLQLSDAAREVQLTKKVA